MVVSIKDFVGKLNALCVSHTQVNSCYHGDVVEILKSKDITYTTVISTAISAAINPTEVTTSFQLMVLDKMLSNKENYLDVESNTLLVLSDLINYIQSNNDIFKYCRIAGTPSATKIEDKAFDVVDGWQVTIQVRLMKDNGTCLTPIEPPTVVCADATYEIKDADANTLYSGSVASGDNLDQTIQDSTVNVRKSDNTLITAVSVLAEGVKDYTVADSPISVNGNIFANVKATDSLDISVLYENGTPVGTIVGGVVEIPGPILKSGIAYVRPMLTGQTSSYWYGDEVWQQINEPYPAHPANPIHIAELANFTTLVNNNIFGNTNRFTDENGLQVYANDYVLDHYTGLGWYRIVQSGLDWFNALDTVMASNLIGFNNWKIPNLSEQYSIFNNLNSRPLNYSPFNNNVQYQFMTSTTDMRNVDNIFYVLNGGASSNLVIISDKTLTTLEYYMCRNF